MAPAAPELALTANPNSEQPAASITTQSSSNSSSTIESSTLLLSSNMEHEREAKLLWVRKMLEKSNKLTHDQLVERVRKSGLQPSGRSVPYDDGENIAYGERISATSV